MIMLISIYHQSIYKGVDCARKSYTILNSKIWPVDIKMHISTALWLDVFKLKVKLENVFKTILFLSEANPFPHSEINCGHFFPEVH